METLIWTLLLVTYAMLGTNEYLRIKKQPTAESYLGLTRKLFYFFVAGLLIGAYGIRLDRANLPEGYHTVTLPVLLAWVFTILSLAGALIALREYTLKLLEAQLGDRVPQTLRLRSYAIWAAFGLASGLLAAAVLTQQISCGSLPPARAMVILAVVWTPCTIGLMRLEQSWLEKKLRANGSSQGS